ncbi:MAG: bifunctional serine/threonine-protein kinase/formylglycine-generating enzyme family protein [Planctomycetota bacterium]
MSLHGAPADDLPEAIEDAVLNVLDGDEDRRADGLEALLLAHPRYEAAIRRWLGQAGVPVPATASAGRPPGATSNGSRSGSSGGGSNGGGAGTEFDATTTLPADLGPYRLLERLGRGGFGTVFRAEQQEPIRRPVAVKVLNPGMDSREILARFAAEREALNRMDHPGIARLLDAGSTPRGRPYCVMELVAGPTLLAHCRKRSLPLRQRIELFLCVLDAMQHAHQKGMLHRDLSSNNVLVADPDGTPQPKVIDFGIAKSLADPLQAGDALTLRGTMMGTPEYMSPEQADGRFDDVDTRADVYALGVQLYELLTDHLPIPSVALRARGIAGVADVVRAFQPALASDAAPPDRRRALRGDLDGILAKALAKAKEERYGGVGEFAADLRRHLADEPVDIARPSAWTRVRKFVRRHRAASALGAVAAASLLAAIGALVYALASARDAAAEAERLRQQSQAKADAGFLLLANAETLSRASDEAAALPPPWPEHRPAYAKWLAQRSEPLGRARAALQARLDADVARADTDDDARRYLRHALDRLDRDFAAFFGADGPHARVARALQRIDGHFAPLAAQHAARWPATTAAIAASDGKAASRAYRGLRLPPLGGLVPLGADPATGLHEFLDLATHEPGYALPRRDGDGRIASEAGTGLVLVLLPAGRMEQGARRNAPGVDGNDEFAADDELRGGDVALDAFLIGRTELTQAHWRRLVGAALRADDPQRPVTNVDHVTARAVLQQHGMDLPTEAQWEYACRAGRRDRWSSGPLREVAATVGWFAPALQPVGLLPPNGFGLCDLHGNAAEWCRDVVAPYEAAPARRGDGLREPRVAAADVQHAVRGGAWHEGPDRARCTARDKRPPGTRDAAIGVRPVRLLPEAR